MRAYLAFTAITFLIATAAVLYPLQMTPHRKGALWYAYAVTAVTLMALRWALAGIAEPEVLGPFNASDMWIPSKTQR
ncbi:hypothetical protein PS467_41390 [Streptomyces luomodiensis]|uniref:Uncharacterized protein n=1 Tax=Streptomyces luomodiensis TaxID=3026192 RepID=A0ABY9VAE6_9ACTN|nr:hypothetical protein [Streptomyces sp. SCA4-21]WNF01878.1 hypothetical protein PS467_41390 [Streptomyces sp. SCA4-21]